MRFLAGQGLGRRGKGPRGLGAAQEIDVHAGHEVVPVFWNRIVTKNIEPFLTVAGTLCDTNAALTPLGGGGGAVMLTATFGVVSPKRPTPS